MADRIVLLTNSQEPAVTANTEEYEITGNEVILCDSTGRVRISDIMAAMNVMNDTLVNLEATVTNIDVNYAKIKTRRSGSILYMTDDGTNP